MSFELSHDERCRLSALVMAVLQDWRLDAEQQLALLGLPAETRPRELTRLSRGAPFPDDPQQIDRARHMLGIHEALHVVFPHNYNMAAFWMRHGNKKFPQSPLEVMLHEGLPGMHRVWSHLDCTQTWD